MRAATLSVTSRSLIVCTCFVWEAVMIFSARSAKCSKAQDSYTSAKSKLVLYLIVSVQTWLFAGD